MIGVIGQMKIRGVYNVNWKMLSELSILLFWLGKEVPFSNL